MSDRPEAVDDPADFPLDTSAQSVQKLIAQGTQTVAAVEGLRDAIDRSTRAQRIRNWIVGLVLLLLAGVAVDSRSQINKLEAKFCPIVLAIAEGTPAPPTGPEGDRSRAVLERFRGLAAGLDCYNR